MVSESTPLSDWQPHEKKVVLKLTLVRHGETVANRDRIVQGQTPGELTDFGREQARRLGKRLANQRWDAFYCSDLDRTQQTAQELLQGAGADVTAIMVGSGPDLAVSPIDDSAASGPGPTADVTADVSADVAAGGNSDAIGSPSVPESTGGGYDATGTKERRSGVKEKFPTMVSMKLLRERSAGQLEGGRSGCVDAAAKSSGVPSRCFRPPNGESWKDVLARADRFLRWIVDTHLQTSIPTQPDGLRKLDLPSESNQTDGIRTGNGDQPETGLVGGFSAGAPAGAPGVNGQRAASKASVADFVSAANDVPRRMLRSGSFTGQLPRSKTGPKRPMVRSESFTGQLPRSESGLRGHMVRSGSFTGEPRQASKILGIPRSDSFTTGESPRVSGVKRAGGFNTLAPKVMKRVDSLGLSKLFTEEMRVEGSAGGERSSVEAESPHGTAGSGFGSAAMEVGDDLPNCRNESDIGVGGGDPSGMDVLSDSDCAEGEMQVVDFVVGGRSRGEHEGEDSRKKTEDRGSLDQNAETSEGRKKGDAALDTWREASGVADGLEGARAPSAEAASSGQRPKVKRTGGRPAVKRVLVVTHGGFIKEFVNASMAYAEGPSLSKTRLQTRQSLEWRTSQDSPGACSHRQVTQESEGVKRRSVEAAAAKGPVQIQRTFGHNDFVSIRAVDENGRCEDLTAQGQCEYQPVPEREADTATDILVPRKMSFSGIELTTSPGGKIRAVEELPGTSTPENGLRERQESSRDSGSGGSGGTANFGAEPRPQSALVYPGRPRNTSVYEFEIKRLEGRAGTPRFTVKMIRENDVYHLHGLVAVRPFHGLQASPKSEAKVLWQSPTAKMLD